LIMWPFPQLGKHYLITDKMSMMGQQMFVDKQLRQARGKPDTPLGFTVILFGNFWTATT